MVNFFIERPIFATVLALLMLLIGGICVFLLPIALYPQIAPPQVQVTTTYTGADAQTVAETVTTPIEQQINGIKGMIYFSSDSTSNGLSKIVATFDVGYSQDIGAVDIQNKVQTAQASLPPEVKQYGVTIKKTSTDMVCVVNLVSPDGRYDANFLDNYGQIDVADVLKRIPGVSDVTSSGGSTRCGSGSTRTGWPTQLISPAEVIAAIQQENRQAAAGKIGGQPVPPGQAFEYPITAKGRLEKVAEFEDIIVRRDDDGSIVRLRGRRPGRARLGELRDRRLRSTASPPGRSRSTSSPTPTPWTSSGRSARDGAAREELPAGPRIPDRLRHDRVRPREHRRGRAHAARGVPAGHDRRVRLPAGVPGDDHPDAGDSRLAGRHVRDDGGVRVLDQHADALRAGAGDRPGGRRRDHRRRERREVPRAGHARRSRRPATAMAEITAPIVTITLVLAAVFVPVAFIPGLTGRLYNQFAMTIVFSFVFSAINSLTFSPAMARLFLKPKARRGEVLPVPLVQRGHASGSRTPTMRSSSHGARTGGRSSRPSVGLLVLMGCMLVERPKAFIPNEDQGYLIVAVQTPDGTTREPTQPDRPAGRRDRREARGRQRRRAAGRPQPDQLARTRPTPATVFVILEEWSKRQDARAPGRRRWPAKLQARLSSEVRGAMALVFQPPPIRGLSQTGGFEFMLEDREGKGVEALATVTDRFLDEAREAARAGRRLHHRSRPASPSSASTSTAPRPGGSTSPSPTSSPSSRRTSAAYYVNDFNLYGKVWKVMVQAEGNGADQARRHPEALRPEPRGEEGPARARWARSRNAVGPIDVPHYNMYNSAKITGQPAPGYSSGQAIARHGGGRRRGPARGLRLRVDRHDVPGAEDGQRRPRYIFALSIVCVFLFMAALYESWIRPLVIILTVPLAMFGAMVGLWLYDMPLDVFGQIGLVMLIGLETKNAILIVEFGVELPQKQGMGILESAKEAVAAAAPADPDDVVRLRHGRPADGPRHRRRGVQPELAGDRHRLRHRCQHRPRPVRDPDLLRPRRAAHPGLLAGRDRGAGVISRRRGAGGKPEDLEANS